MLNFTDYSSYEYSMYIPPPADQRAGRVGCHTCCTVRLVAGSLGGFGRRITLVSSIERLDSTFNLSDNRPATVRPDLQACLVSSRLEDKPKVTRTTGIIHGCRLSSNITR